MGVVRGFNEEELKQYFKPYTQLYKNTQGVVEEMKLLLNQIDLSSEEKSELIELAYLHKIGFLPKTIKTGFEPLDGALYCKSKNYSLEVVTAVMYCSGAYEIVVRNFPDLLDIYLEYKQYFTSKIELYIDLITFCDLHRSSTGLKVTFIEKKKEIYDLYGEDHNFSNTLKSIESILTEQIKRVEALKITML